MKKFNFAIVLFFTVQTLFAQVNFTDTILYPQSKGAADTSSFKLMNFDKNFTTGISQTYNANTGIIHGMRVFVLLDTNGIPSAATKDVMIRVVNVDGLSQPATVIGSSVVTLFDVGTAEQTLLFDTPIPVTGKYAITLEFDTADAGYNPVTDTLWYLTNDATTVPPEGNREGLMAVCFGSYGWYNQWKRYNSPQHNYDAMLSPIFETTITPSYATNADSICLGDTVQFTNTSTFSTDYMYNRWDSLGLDPYAWNYDDGSGSYNHTDTTYTYADSGSFNTQLIIKNYGYTNTWVDTVDKVVAVIKRVVTASTDTIVCFGDTLHLSATGALTYSWDNGLGAGQTQTPTGSIDTMYIVEGTDGLGCVGIDTVHVTINALPNVIASTDTTVCAGDTVFLAATGAVSYSWDNGFGAGQFQDTIPTIDTMYVVEGTDGLGCVGIDTVNVVINLPNVIASTDTSVCAGDTVFLSATGAVSYNWDNGLGAGQTQTPIGSIDTLYVVEGTDGLGCVDLDTVNVTINALPNVIASTDTTVCSGDTVFLAATGAVSYNWDNGLGAGQTQTPTGSIDTLYVVAGTDGLGCVDLDTVHVLINELPVVVTSNDDAICSGDSVLISAISTSPNYTWDNGLGSGQQQQISPSIATDYVVSTVDANNCVGLDTVTITVNALPVLSLNADTNLCFGDSIVLAVSGADTYSWDNGLGAGSTHTTSPSTGTTYIVEGTDTNACVNTDSVTVSVTVVDVIASADTSVCAGDTLFLAATGAVSYSWDNGLGAGQFQDTIPTMDTLYVVAGTDGMGCVGMDTVNVVINELPVVVTSNDDAICIGDSVFISAISTSPNYTWDNGLGSGQQQKISPSIATDYVVSTVDANNCVGLDTVTITVNALPVLSLNADTNLCFGESIVLAVSGADTYSWDNGLGAGSTHTTSPSTGTTYIVEATDTNACVNTDSVTVSVTVVDVIASADTSVCAGDTVFLAATGAVSYNWDNGLGAGQFQDTIPTRDTLYVVAGTDGMGCVGMDTVHVLINELPSVVTSNDDTICSGDSVLISAISTSPNYTWDNGLGSGQQQKISPSIATDYVVSTVDANNCVGLDTVTITVNALPVLSLNADTNLCFGESIVLAVSGADTYSWDNGLGAGSTHTTTPSTGTTYIVEGTDTNACVNTDSVTVSVTVVNVIASTDTSVCAGDTVFLAATGAVSYSWDNGLGAGQFQDTIPTMDTTYVVAGTDGMGCVGFDTVNVLINELPVVVTSSDDVICIGDSQFISAISTSPNYTWDNGLGSGQQQKISPSIATDYIVSTVDANNCVGLDTVTITVNALPVLSLNADTNLCFGESIVLAVSGADTYSWDNGLGAGSTHTTTPSTGTTYIVEGTDTNACVNTDSVTVSVTVVNVIASTDTSVCAGDTVFLAATGAVSYNWDNGLGAGQFQDTIPTMDTTYVVAGTDGMGCVGFDTVNVVINELPVVVTSSDDVICIGDSQFISAISTSPNYTWDNGLGSGQQQKISPSIATDYIVSTVDANNCVGLDTVRITVNALPVLSLNADTNLCFGESLVLAVSGADTYNWDNGLGAGSTHTISPSTGSTYIVEATDTNACVNTDSVTVLVTVVNVTASADTNVCAGDAVFLAATGAVSYNWDNGLGAGQFQDTIPTMDTTYVVAGTDGMGCVGMDTVHVVINELPVVVTSSDDTICRGDSLFISALSTSPNYSWDNGLGSGQQQQVAPSISTAYIVSTLDVNNCIGLDTVSISINALPVLSLNTDTAICFGDSIVLVVNGADTYSWNNGLGEGSTHTTSPSTGSTYIVEATDTNACVNTDSVTVMITVVDVIASNDVTVCLGASTVISASGANVLAWNNNLGSGDEFEITPTVSANYIVVGIENGCIAADTLMVTVDNLCFNVPNVFTPNGDGKNEVWNIAGLEQYPEAIVKVFNRGGDVVFESVRGYTESWDGTFNGVTSAATTYYYVIDLGDAGGNSSSGTINIIR